MGLFSAPQGWTPPAPVANKLKYPSTEWTRDPISKVLMPNSQAVLDKLNIRDINGNLITPDMWAAGYTSAEGPGGQRDFVSKYTHPLQYARGQSAGSWGGLSDFLVPTLLVGGGLAADALAAGAGATGAGATGAGTAGVGASGAGFGEIGAGGSALSTTAGGEMGVSSLGAGLSGSGVTPVLGDISGQEALSGTGMGTWVTPGASGGGSTLSKFLTAGKGLSSILSGASGGGQQQQSSGSMMSPPKMEFAPLQPYIPMHSIISDILSKGGGR